MSTAAIAPEGGRGKTLDANRYATKKTIAQGMLDIALLTANASQLKYILQAGKEHEFYTLMVTLISVSIILQVVVGVVFLVIGGLDINRDGDQRAALVLNDLTLVLVFVISLINVIISGFGMEHSSHPIVLAHRRQALQAALCVALGSALDINKPRQQRAANAWNNVVLALNIVITAVNVVLSAFDMRSTGLPEAAGPGTGAAPMLPPGLPTAPPAPTPAPTTSPAPAFTL